MRRDDNGVLIVDASVIQLEWGNFCCNFTYHGLEIAKGEGETKREAKKAAAFIATEQLKPSFEECELYKRCDCQVDPGKVFGNLTCRRK
jgi:hypothetical protein